MVSPCSVYQQQSALLGVIDTRRKNEVSVYRSMVIVLSRFTTATSLNVLPLFPHLEKKPEHHNIHLGLTQGLLVERNKVCHSSVALLFGKILVQKDPPLTLLLPSQCQAEMVTVIVTDIGGKTETGEDTAAALDPGLGPDLPIENVIEGIEIGIAKRKAEKRIGGIGTQDGEGGQINQSPMPGGCIRWMIETLPGR